MVSCGQIGNDTIQLQLYMQNTSKNRNLNKFYIDHYKTSYCSLLLTIFHEELIFVKLKKILFYFDSDLEIAKAQLPKNIASLAREIDLLPDEVELYGKKKAKISLKVLNRLKGSPNGKYVVVAG